MCSNSASQSGVEIEGLCVLSNLKDYEVLVFRLRKTFHVVGHSSRKSETFGQSCSHKGHGVARS